MADTGYTPFPTVNPTVDGLPPQSIQADEESFGAGVGRSLRRTGAIVRQAADQEFALKLRFAEMENETKALDANTEYTRQSNKIVNDFRQLNGQQAVDALPEVEKSLVRLDQEIGKGLKTPGAQRAYKSRSQNILTSAMSVTGLHAGNQANAANDAAKVAAVGAAQSRFVTNFGLTDTKPDVDEIVSLTSDLAYERGLPKEAADVLVQNSVGEALLQVMNVRVSQGKFDEARAIFDEAKASKIPGTDLPVFNADKIVAVTNQLEQAENLERIDQARQAEAADKFKRDQSEASYKKYVDQIITDPTKLDIKAVAKDPYLSGQHGETLLRLYQEQINKLKGGGDADENKGPGFWDAFRAVTAPNSPIKTPQQIYELTGPGRPLTLTGARSLVTLMNERRTGAQTGNFQSQATTRFFTNVHAKIAKPYGGSTAEGEQKYFEFYMNKSQQIADGIAAGKTIDQLLNPKSSDYIANDIQEYIPVSTGDDIEIEEDAGQSKTSFSDWFNWLFGGGGDQFSTQKLDQSIPAGAEGSASGLSSLKGAMAAGQITREAAEEYAHKRGWLAPVAPSAPRDYTAMPRGMIEAGGLTLDDVGNNWSTFEVAEDGIHKTLVLPTRPGDRPADDATGFLGDAIERWKKNRQAMVGAFEDESSARATMQSVRPPQRAAVPPAMR